MRASRRRVVLANVSADDNRGGCAITFSTLAMIRDAIPDAAVELIPAAGIDDVADALRHTRAAFPDVVVLPPIAHRVPARSMAVGAARGIAAAVRAQVARPPAATTLGHVVRASLVVTRGDALYVDRPSVRGLLSVAAASLPAVTATRWNVPAVLTGTELGPFAHAPSRLLAAAVTRRAGRIVVRNDDSRAHAISLGVRSDRIEVLPDTAFGFPAPAPAAPSAIARRLGLPLGRTAVVTVGADTSIEGMAEFERRFTILLRHLLDRGAVDQVAVVVQVDGRHISDRAKSARFVAAAADARFRLIDADLDPHELTALSGAAAVTLGTRMHSSILSLVAGTPTFPVAVWPKIRKLFGPLGLADSVIPFPDPEPMAIAARIAAAIADPSARPVARQTAERQLGGLRRYREILLAASS